VLKQRCRLGRFSSISGTDFAKVLAAVVNNSRGFRIFTAPIMLKRVTKGDAYSKAPDPILEDLIRPKIV
jgi:hypothetical protein